MTYLSLHDKFGYYTFNFYAIEEVQVKGFYWDATCIQGLDWPANGNINVTVFPNAIAQGATFDTELVRRAGNATAYEFRSLRKPTDGAIPGVCDGGPLANTAHDPRWGRNSETYGEDPFLSARMGVNALHGLQSRTIFNGKEFVLIPQVTRHFMGFHGAKPDCDATMHADQRNLEESYYPIYEAFQVEGKAEGIMCSYADINGVPACANKEILQHKLRDEWQSDALIQCDCCDSISAIKDHGYVDTDYEALIAAVDAGVQLYYGYKRKDYVNYWNESIHSGDLTVEQLDAAVAHTFKLRFRMGEFDDIPWNHLPDGIKESQEHFDLARELGAASVVLLKNKNNILPLVPGKYKKIAVIGPFAHCKDVSRGRGYGSRNCYLHNYSGAPSRLVTILDAFTEEGSKNGFDVKYELGVNATGDARNDSLLAAVTLARESDLVILCLGLGDKVEAEGLDRSNLLLPELQQTLLEQIQSTGTPIVMPLVSAGGIDLPYTEVADAIMQVWYGGQSTGYSVTDIAMGRVVPSGRLPLTVYSNDTLALLPNITRFNLEEGAGRTYRYLNTDDSVHSSWFGFGYGLSYSKFEYGNLHMTSNGSVVTVMFNIKNTGDYDAHEVYQVYVKQPTQGKLVLPKYSLKGFGRVFIEKGKMACIEVMIKYNDLRTVLADGSKKFVQGTYIFYAGGAQPQEKNPTSSGQVLQKAWSPSVIA